MQTTTAAHSSTTLESEEFAAFYLISAMSLADSAYQLNKLHSKLPTHPQKGLSNIAAWDGYWYTKREAERHTECLRQEGALLHYGCPAALEAAKAIKSTRDATRSSMVAA